MQQHALGASVIYKLTNLMQKLFNAKVIYGWYCHLGCNRPANPLITVQCTWDKGKNKPEKVQGCRSDLVASFVSSWSHFYHLPETSLVIASFIASSIWYILCHPVHCESVFTKQLYWKYTCKPFWSCRDNFDRNFKEDCGVNLIRVIELI